MAKEYLRFIMVAYLNLTHKLKNGAFTNYSSVMDVLEASVIDLKIRQTVGEFTKEIFDLMPKPKI